MRATIAAMFALPLGAVPAQATLVPAELRTGDDLGTAPLVPLFDPAEPLKTSLALREVSPPRLEYGSGNPLATCPPRPRSENSSRPRLTSNGPVVGEQFIVSANNCSTSILPSTRIEAEIAADAAGSFRMRYETVLKRKFRNGVIESTSGNPFRVVAHFFDRATGAPEGGCVYTLSSLASIEVYNRGNGHSIVFDREPVNLTSTISPGVCLSGGPYYLSAVVRLRGWDPKPNWPTDWTLPVWLRSAPVPAFSRGR
jgi:hypothetical protein